MLIVVGLVVCVPKTCANWADALRTPSAQSRELCLAGRSGSAGVRGSSACGLEAGLPRRDTGRVGAGPVPAGGLVEGRRDPDAASSARGGPARAAEGSFGVDMAGPGVAGVCCP